MSGTDFGWQRGNVDDVDEALDDRIAGDKILSAVEPVVKEFYEDDAEVLLIVHATRRSDGAGRDFMLTAGVKFGDSDPKLALLRVMAFLGMATERTGDSLKATYSADGVSDEEIRRALPTKEER